MVPEVFHLPAGEAAELLDHIHVEYAAAQRAHPDHVAGLAALPMQDPSLALKVLDHAIGDLDLRGVSLVTLADDKRPLVTEDSLRVFARIAELGVPLVLHPGFRSATRFGLRTFREEAGLSWAYQTSLMALRLIDEGVLDTVPDLVVVHPHLGGVLPYVAQRIEDIPVVGKARHPVEHYFKTNFYVDTAAGNPRALRLAVEAYGIDRVVFATDYPFYDMSAVRQQVEDTVGPQAARQIYANRVPGLRLPAPRLPGAETAAIRALGLLVVPHVDAWRAGVTADARPLRPDPRGTDLVAQHSDSGGFELYDVVRPDPAVKLQAAPAADGAERQELSRVERLVQRGPRQDFGERELPVLGCARRP
jgi:predicted TIM-barrel fold metal-dependent hydrolase